MDSEQLTPAKLAEMLGVQRSAISHILTGRNNPSFDLIGRIVGKFPALSSEWLITGKGDMYKTLVQGSLFDLEAPHMGKAQSSAPRPLAASPALNTNVSTKGAEGKGANDTSVKNGGGVQRMVKRVVIFYTDSTFEEFISAP